MAQIKVLISLFSLHVQMCITTVPIEMYSSSGKSEVSTESLYTVGPLWIGLLAGKHYAF
jgi:hypothetical protein